MLIVEDDLDIRESLAEVLVDNGYQVDLAGNGREALVRLAAGHPDVILLDLMMPIMDGWELRAELDKDAALRDIPVVILTADGNAREAAAQMRAQGCLRKPVRIEGVLAAIEKA